MKSVKLIASALALAAGSATAAAARDEIRIVGSSTVFPYTQAVAEQFSSMTGAASPIVESTGTGGGMKIFCEGVGEAHPDITGASRAMKESEFQRKISKSCSGSIIVFQIPARTGRKGPG